DYLKSTDLFEFGMVPQFIARFENVVLLDDLSINVLKEILLKSYESPFVRSKRYFKVMNIELSIEELAAALIAEEAVKDSRTGARALRPIFFEIINPLEFDPWTGKLLEERDDGGWSLRVTADMARQVLK
ncbi:MAG: hypothetical protein GY833_17880, partial [Aestuariibacter sp.]|nr:hypothetical protein [Aestuariibacter sp.]